jgi:glycosyltransferase involved in cell wall biosynthesis
LIVYIITKLELGGAQKVCLTLANEVAKSMQTALISGTHGILVASTEDLAHRYLLPSLEREIGLFSFLADLRSFIEMIKILRRLKKKHPTLIVHTHSTKAGILGRWAAFFAGVGIRIHTIHGYAFHNNQSRIGWLLRYLPELITSFITKHFVCVSQCDQTTGKRLFPGFEKKNSLIRAAVDDIFFDNHQPTSKPYDTTRPFVVGTIACFKPQKNLVDLLKAFQLVHTTLISSGHRPPELHIIGDGEQRPILTAWVAEHHLTEAVFFLGWQQSVQPFLLHWDVFALTSLWEGLPCAIIEARLSHLPVIAYNTGGIAEIIQTNKNGYIVAQGAWEELAQHLIQLAINPTLQHALALCKNDLMDFHNKTMVKTHTTLYNSLLGIKK